MNVWHVITVLAAIAIILPNLSYPVMGHLGDGRSGLCDMVIIAPKKFSKALKPLVRHKNSIGIRTRIVPVEMIYKSFEGRDQQEKIKMFIKFALENWHIKFVLLVGGAKEIPVRYVWNEDYGRFIFPDKFYSDLYYADIFDREGNFVSWDSNNNSKFGEWWCKGKDILDLYPDVYIGRLPCRNIFEVKVVVNKIIRYESEALSKKPWFNRVLVTGGDWYDETPRFYDVDYAAERVAKMMKAKGFDVIRLYASLGNLSTKNIYKVINSGVGFAFFAPGDGLRTKWYTSINESCSEIEFSVRHIVMCLHNHEKLPIVVVGGCLINDIDPYGGYPTPLQRGECWGWSFVSKVNGGAIAVIGSTGSCFYRTVKDFFVLLEEMFFKIYCTEKVTYLGELWGKTISRYLDLCPVRWDLDRVQPDGMNCKNIEMFSLIGDPSLVIGGKVPADGKEKLCKPPCMFEWNNDRKDLEDMREDYHLMSDFELHSPIVIDGDKDLTPENGVRKGNGTEDDPYIIECWAINASNSTGISIRNTSAYILVNKCFIFNGRRSSGPPGFLNDGLELKNVKNCHIQNCLFVENGIGVRVVSSKNISLKNLTVRSNDIGISIIKSSGVKVYGCTVEGCMDDGLRVIDSSNLVVSSNYIDDCYFSNIRVAYSTAVRIEDCLLIDRKNLSRSVGIILYASNNSKIENCTLKGFSFYGIVLSEGFDSASKRNEISNCKIYECGFSGIAIYGVGIDPVHKNCISHSKIFNNDVRGITILNSKENLIKGCVIYNNSVGICSNYILPYLPMMFKKNHIHNCNIYQNDVALFCIFSNLDARYNWWGTERSSIVCIFSLVRRYPSSSSGPYPI